MADACRSKGSKGRANSGIILPHSAEQTDQPLLHSIVKIQARGRTVGGSLADGRHHAGDERGKRIFIPLLCAGGQILIE